MGWGSRALGAAFLAAALAGCTVVGPTPGVEFAGQEEVLAAAAAAAGYEPDPQAWQLVHSEIGLDFASFQYRGIGKPGDRAWTIRFARKSTEQRPEDLATLDGLLATVEDGKDGFQILEKAARKHKGLQVEYARYRYRSPIRGDRGSPLPAGGAVALVIREGGPAPVIYQIDVDNFEGDRPNLGWEELRPLVDAIGG